MTNQYRITLASFLAYFIMSGMLAPIGIISGPMALDFGVPVTEVTARFSWLTLGIFVGAVAALVVFQWASVKSLMIAVYALIGLSLASLLADSTLDLVALRLGLTGACCGVGLPAAALVISRTYEAERRASMLVITDGFFSVAGIVCSWLAVMLIARNVHWSGPYLFIAAVALALVTLSVLSTFPENEAAGEDLTGSWSWPPAAWMCLGVLGLYTLAQNSILLWLPQYAQTQLDIAPEPAGQMVGQFWTGMFAAQVFVAWWVLRIGVTRLLWLAAIGACTFSLPLWLVDDVDALLVLATVWGFANLGLLKVVVAYATQLTAVASPQLVSSLLLGATTGTAVSPWISSQVVAAAGPGAALQLGSALYGVMVILLLAATKLADSAAHRS